MNEIIRNTLIVTLGESVKKLVFIDCVNKFKYRL